MSIKKLDIILDKINASGINSLLTIEKIYLNKSSKKENVDYIDKFLSNEAGCKIYQEVNNVCYEFEYADTEMDDNIKHLGILRFKEMEFFGYIIVNENGDYLFPELFSKEGNSLIEDYELRDNEINDIEDFLNEVAFNLSDKIIEE